jgi:anti-repressor protein
MQLDLLNKNFVEEKNGELFVSSLVISESINYEHRAVLQLIRQNIDDFREFGRVSFQMQPFETNGGVQNREVIFLNEDQSTLLITYFRNNDLTKKFKINLVKAFSLMKKIIQEQNNFNLPKTFSEALLLASKQAEQIEKQNALLLEQKPKVEFFEAVTNSKSAIDMGQVAKVLDKDIGRNKLFEILRNKKILQKDNIPFQTYIDRGYFRVIEVKYTKPDGSTNISLKTLVYQKGVNFINKVLES